MEESRFKSFKEALFQAAVGDKETAAEVLMDDLANIVVLARLVYTYVDEEDIRSVYEEEWKAGP